MIAQASGTTGQVFVDSHLPPADSDYPIAPAGYAELIAPLAVDGVLPKWADWWTTALDRLVPNPTIRAALYADMPRVPLDFFRGTVRAASGWTRLSCGYVRLSEAFEASASEAEARGWPVVRFRASHLHLAVDPRAVAEAIIAVAPPGRDRRARRPTGSGRPAVDACVVAGLQVEAAESMRAAVTAIAA
jgi:hypothetical protein